LAETILEVTDLVKEFPVRAGLLQHQVATVKAVSGVSLSVEKGQTLGIVGESGCGKSTTGRLILRLIEATSGSVKFRGNEVLNQSSRAIRQLRQKMQIVFQDPYASLNPRMTVQTIIAEPMVIHRTGRKKAIATRVKDLMELVGLKAEHASRFPHEFSGGQRQPSASRAPSPSIPSSSSSTSRFLRSTCRSRPVSSTCSKTSRTSWACPTCSSPMISPWCATSPTWRP